MMTNNIEPASAKTGKVVMQLLIGGLVGGVAGYFGAELLTRADASAGQAAVAGVGLIYLMMGLFCGAGVAVPKIGAKMLNVEDESELREQRRVLTGSAICMGAIGAALLILAAAGAASAIPSGAAFGGILLASLLGVLITWRDWKYYDELILQVSRDAGNYAFLGVGGFIMLWSAAAYLGFASALSPLSLIALVTGGLLLAVFIAAGRRGMLKPR
jgi:hypothetical protein